MKKTTVRAKLVCESVSMINSTALRFLSGESWKWCRGMLVHHLSQLLERCEHDTVLYGVEDMLTSEAREVLDVFYGSLDIPEEVRPQIAEAFKAMGVIGSSKHTVSEC